MLAKNDPCLIRMCLARNNPDLQTSWLMWYECVCGCVFAWNSPLIWWITAAPRPFWSSRVSGTSVCVYINQADLGVPSKTEPRPNEPSSKATSLSTFITSTAPSPCVFFILLSTKQMMTQKKFSAFIDKRRRMEPSRPPLHIYLSRSENE